MSLIEPVNGKPLALREEEERRVGVPAGVPMLGLDALSSSLKAVLIGSGGRQFVIISVPWYLKERGDSHALIG